MTEIQKPYDLKGRSLLKESDFTKAEFDENACSVYSCVY